MRRRSTEIIQKIIRDSDRTLTVRELASHYGISQKTLKNDIKEINQFLRTIPVGEIRTTEEGKLILGTDFEEELVENYLYEMDAYMYKLSPKERQIYILMELASSQTYITMQHIAEELYVSRITIVNDMEVIKESMKSFQGKLILDSGKGMLLKFQEKERISILVELYRSIAINVENEGFFQRMILNRMEIRHSFSILFEYMQEYMKVSNLVFIEDVFYDIVLYLFVVFNFCRREGRAVTGRTPLSGIDHMILYAGHMLEVTVTEDMMKGFREYIADHKLYSFVKTVDEIELYKVIMNFVGKIDQEMNLDLVSDTKLMDSLLMHIRSIKDWGNYEVELPKEYDSSINYERLEELVSQYAYILEGFLSYHLSGNMKKSIVIHICVAIIRNRRYLPKISVVIVCPGSMATGKYLEAQIKNYFDFNIIGVLAAHEVIGRLKYKEEPVDFIISTVPIHTKEYQVIKVHPFLQMDDLNLIQKLTFQRHTLKPETIQHKMEILSGQICSIMEDAKLAEILCRKLEEVIIEYQRETEGKKKNPIEELLDEDLIEIENSVIPWREAMYRSARPLIERGYISEDYIETSIRNVEEYGDYIVVSRGVALAHAGGGNGVYRDGLSLLVSRKGIDFTETEEPVHLLFCFASAGRKDYLELIREIIWLGRTKGKVKEIKGLPDTLTVYEELVSCGNFAYSVENRGCIVPCDDRNC